MTLIEIVVALGILSMLTGAIYGIVSGSIESTTTLSLIAAEDRRVEAFLERTRAAFVHLPVGATVELKVLENEPLRQELIIRGVSDAFIWGENGWWENPTITLAPLRWPDDRLPPPARAEMRGKGQPVTQRFSFAMSAPDFYREDLDGQPLAESPLQSRRGNALVQPDIQGRFWLDLLPEVDRVEWRFYDPAKKVWLELSPAARPPLIELRLSLPGRKIPIRVVFETV